MNRRIKSAMSVSALVVATSVATCVSAPASSAADSDFVVSPTAIDFAEQPVGGPGQTQAVNITNVSQSTQSVSIAGGAAGVFGGVTNCGSSLAPSASCQIFYAFNPTTTGRVHGTTTIAVDGGPNHRISFTGIGTPEFLLSPTSFDFGRVAIGSTGIQQSMAVTNKATQPATLSGAGGAAGVFGGVQDCPHTFNADAVCHYMYRFAPDRIGLADVRSGGSLTNTAISPNFTQTWVTHFTGVGTGTAADDYVAMPASRILNASSIAAGHTRQVSLPSAGVASNAIAGDLAVTARGHSSAGSLVVWPCGSPTPARPTLYFPANGRASTHVLAAPDNTGAVCIKPSKASDVSVDIDGYYPATSSYYSDSGLPLADTGTGKLVPAGHVTRVHTNVFVVPRSSAAVAVQVSVLRAPKPGRLVVWPCGSSVPARATALSYGTASTTGLAITPLDSKGRVCVVASTAARLVVDLVGSYAGQATFVAQKSRRVLDTARGIGRGSEPTANSSTALGRGGAPADARAMVVDVTASAAKAPGALTVRPCGTTGKIPLTVTYRAHQTATALAVVPTGTNGKVCVSPTSTVQIAADVVGWYLAAQP